MVCRASCVWFLGLISGGAGTSSSGPAFPSREPRLAPTSQVGKGKPREVVPGPRTATISRPRLALRSLQNVPRGARGPWLCRPSRGPRPEGPDPTHLREGLRFGVGEPRRFLVPGAEAPASPPRSRRVPPPGSGSLTRRSLGCTPAHVARPGGEAPSLPSASGTRAPVGRAAAGGAGGRGWGWRRRQVLFPHLENGRHHPPGTGVVRASWWGAWGEPLAGILRLAPAPESVSLTASPSGNGLVADSSTLPGSFGSQFRDSVRWVPAFG